MARANDRPTTFTAYFTFGTYLVGYYFPESHFTSVSVGTEQSIPLEIGGMITPYKVITSLSSYSCKIKFCPYLMKYAHVRIPPLTCLILLATRMILFFCIGLVSRPPHKNKPRRSCIVSRLDNIVMFWYNVLC